MENRKSVNNCLVLYMLFLRCYLVYLAPIEKAELVNTHEALEFLQDYGYLQTSGAKAGSLLSENDFEMSLRRMQRFAGVSETGKLDKETMSLVNTNRCGVPDFETSPLSKRQRRYAIHNKKWDKSVLTWRIHSFGNDGLKKSKVRKTFKDALEKWANVTNLSFREILTGEPDIWFKFVTGDHGDNSPFKLPWSRVIAHAFYPKYGKIGLAGDVHFNDAKRFAIASRKGKNLLWITLHELGHSIGLKHSSVKDAIMYPYYRGYTGKDFELTPDDVSGAQALYGIKTQTTAITPAHTTMEPGTKDGCFSRISAIFIGANKKTYLFNSGKLRILNKYLGLEKGPISVGKVFKGVTSVDAAFRRYDGNTVLFSGDSYFVYDMSNAYISGPHMIEENFGGLTNVKSIDAAFVWPATNTLYLFKGEQYWRYSSAGKGTKYSLDRGYPKEIRIGWKGIPNHIDGVFTWRDGVTYIFKGEKYYGLNERLTVKSNFPKSVSKDWAKSQSCSRKAVDIQEEASSASITLSQITVVASLAAIASFVASNA